MPFEEVVYGDWKILIDRNEVVTITPEVKAQIEDFLADYLRVAMWRFREDYPVHNLSMTRFGIPSPVIRLDMPPATNGFRGTYEVEANTAGLGIDHRMGIGITDECAKFLADAGIRQLGFGIAPGRDDQRVDHEIFMRELGLLGIETIEVDPTKPGAGGDLPLWLRAGQEDIDADNLPDDVLARCLLLHSDGGGNKGYLLDLCGARMLSSFETAHDVFETFPDGFVYKPIADWGTHSVEAFCPHKPFKKPGHSFSRMLRELSSMIYEGDKWIIQPFGQPEIVHVEHSPSKRFRIWRIYAIWNGSHYEVAGGHWSQRPSLKVHGASDTESGPVILG